MRMLVDWVKDLSKFMRNAFMDLQCFHYCDKNMKDIRNKLSVLAAFATIGVTFVLSAVIAYLPTANA